MGRSRRLDQKLICAAEWLEAKANASGLAGRFSAPYTKGGVFFHRTSRWSFPGPIHA